MFSVLKLIVPIAVLGFVFLRLKRTTFFLISIPLILSLGQSVYFEDYLFTLHLPFVPFTLSWQETVFLILVLAWLLTRYLFPKINILYKRISGLFMANMWLLFILFQLILSFILEDRSAIQGLLGSKSFLILPLSILLFIDIFRRSSFTDVLLFITTVSRCMVLLAILNILSAVGIPVYEVDPQRITYFTKGMIVRQSATFPPLVPLALSYYLTQNRMQLRLLAAIMILFLAMFLTGTRSYLIPGLLIILASAIIPIILRRSFLQGLKRIALYSFGVLILLIFMQSALPENVDFILSRTVEFAIKKTQAETLVQRTSSFDEIKNYQSKNNQFIGIGVGKPQEEIDSAKPEGRYNDMLWSYLLFYFGYPGVILFGVFLFGFLLISFKSLLHNSNEIIHIGSMSIMLMIWIIFRTTSSSDILSLYPIGHGFLIALIVYVKNNSVRVEKVN
jgi:hypothetical protein